MFVITMDELEKLLNTGIEVNVISKNMSKVDVLKKFTEDEELVKQLFFIFYDFEIFEFVDEKDDDNDITDLVNLVLTEMMLPLLEDKYVVAKSVRPRHPFDVAKVIPLIPAYFIWTSIVCLPEDKRYALVEIDEAEENQN